MSRRLKILTAASVGLAALAIASLPPRSVSVPAASPTTVRGAFHIHSNRSDGSGSVDAIASAAARAGLQFIILTDHGDATRTPEPPSYRSGVLTIDGVELNTTGGHFAAAGVSQSPYPIAGTPADVIADVHRLGGFGFAAHGASPRASLSWQEWGTPIDGLEWINSDSEWRDEERLPIARALLTYLLRAPESMVTLLDRSEVLMRRWDELSAARRVVGIAGADAHARLGIQQRTDPDMSAWHIPLPGYEATFRVFTNRVELSSLLSGEAASDARAVLTAIRNGHLYSVIDAIATPGALSFTATSGGVAATMGDDLPVQGDVVVRASARAPAGTALVLIKNGQQVQRVVDGPLELNGGRERAVYRVEAYTPNGPGQPPVPWIVSNPIYVGFAREAAAVTAAPIVSHSPARTTEAARESGATDTSDVTVVPPQGSGEAGLRWRFGLSPGAATGQFAAVPIPISGGIASFDRVQFRVSASKPMRAWVQLRASVGHTDRWGATFYADDTPRLVDLPFEQFRPIGQTGSVHPPLDRVEFLLFVVDTLNTLPGTTGQIDITQIAFVK